jgi:glycosyltransferase involved in cell wall biosynthesis
MKILNVNMTLDPVTGGGTVERTFQMSRFLVKAGMECTLLTTNAGSTPQRTLDLEQVKVTALRTMNNRFYLPRFSYNSIKNLVRDADIVHLMNHWTIINALVYRTCRKLNKPYVVCPAGSLPIYGRSRNFKKLFNLIIGARIIRNADGHVAIAVNEIDQFQAYGVESDRVSIIPNGINVADFQVNDSDGFRRKYGLRDNPFIMFIGRLNTIKGPELLLQAFLNQKDRLKDFHLVFVGPDGGMLSKLKEMVAKLGVDDRVHFLGYLGGADKSRAYHAADLLIIPSRQEAMSIVVLEAGITGTPVLLTDQCGFNEVIGIGGGQVVPASVDGLQQGLVEILREPAQLKSMGANLKKYVFEHFTWDVVIEKYLGLYHKILDTRK